VRRSAKAIVTFAAFAKLGCANCNEVEQEAMNLPEAHGATLDCRPLDSLPAVLSDYHEGVAEALLRRDAELERDSPAGLSLLELRRALRRWEWG
jgi:hypothetical protein